MTDDFYVRAFAIAGSIGLAALVLGQVVAAAVAWIAALSIGTAGVIREHRLQAELRRDHDEDAL